MNGQHLRALPVEELAPKVGEALVEGGVCKDASSAFATGAAALLQGSLELVGDVVDQANDVMGYNVSIKFDNGSAVDCCPCWRLRWGSKACVCIHAQDLVLSLLPSAIFLLLHKLIFSVI